jgi:DNA-binding MarR family transcriptional regulator
VTEVRDHVDRFLDAYGDNFPAFDVEVEGIVDRINGLSRRVLREMDQTLEGFGLNSGEYKVLGALLLAGAPHRLSPGELARREDLSSGAMTNRLDRLEEAGLARRLPDPRDRRAVQVELTEAGKRAWGDAFAAQAQKEALVASTLNKREKKELNALLRRLMLAFEQRESKPRKMER